MHRTCESSYHPIISSHLTPPPSPPPTHLLQSGELPQEMTRTLIPTRIIVQVQLMVTLGIPPLARGQNFGRDAVIPPLLVRLLRHLLRHRLLLLAVVEDARPVLRADVGPLPVGGGRVVHAVEVLDDVAVAELRRVEDELAGFRVYSSLRSAFPPSPTHSKCGVYSRPVRPLHTAR